MKTLIKSGLVALIASVAFSISTTAQIKTIENALTEFNSLEISGSVASSGFVVDVQQANDYFISLTADGAVMEYIDASIKHKTLVITLNEKAIPSEIKKMYKARGSVPCTLKATIYVPYLNNIRVEDNTTLIAFGEYNVSDFSLHMSGSSTLKGLTVNAKNVSLDLEKNSSSILSVSADNFNLNASGKAKATIEQSSVDMNAKLSGNSEVELNGSAVDVKVDASNYAKAKFIGKGNSLYVKGTGSSDINALNFKISNCECVLSNHAIVYEEAIDLLKLDLSGDSKVVFDGTPSFDIVKILSSTVVKYEPKESK